jgi:hypothetical protein
MPSIRVRRATNRRARAQADALVLETVRRHGGKWLQAREILRHLSATLEAVPNVLNACFVLSCDPSSLARLRPRGLLRSLRHTGVSLDFCPTELAFLIYRATHLDNNAFVPRGDTGVLVPSTDQLVLQVPPRCGVGGEQSGTTDHLRDFRSFSAEALCIARWSVLSLWISYWGSCVRAWCVYPL